MKYAAFFMLSAVFLCSSVLAGEPPPAQAGKPSAEPAGATVQAPSALHLKIAGNGLLLTWTLSPQDPGTVTGYEIVRADVFSGPYETVGKVEPGVASFVDRTAKPEVIYFYKVRALIGSQPSPYSAPAAGELPGRLGS